MPLPTVFVSYSHKDEAWKKILLPQLEVLVQEGLFEVWEDRRIDAGDSWYPEIRAALEKADAAVCLISAHYLSSPFVRKEEVPFLLEKREKNGLLLLPVLLSACPWHRVDWLKAIEMVPHDGKTIDGLPDSTRNEIFAQVADQIATAVERPRDAARGITREGSSRVSSPLHPQPEKIDLTRLPVTGAELFGRAEELGWLDELWDTGEVRIATLVAWGGVGKSTLVNKWLERMEPDGFRGARKVFGWTFFRQGTGERSASADLFFGEALRFFGDSEPESGSPWAKGERLADLICREKNLLVLDGVEPLQSAVEGGWLEDAGLAALLTRLAQSEQGLCLITTRKAVADLDEFVETAVSRDLEQISPEAGRALLRVRGIRGSDAELEQVARSFGGHALAVNLLASYLQAFPGHAAEASAEIPRETGADAQSRHPRRIMEAFVRRFGPGPEVELLLLLGLFDRPAEAKALAALRAAPPISRLTDHLTSLPETDWFHLVSKLRGSRLIAEEDPNQPEALDAHPLVREHFGEKLAKENPASWREAHCRLYQYYKEAVETYPDTAPGLTPLFAAVVHGCKAGKTEEALEEVFRTRVLRKKRFSTSTLGLWGINLQVLTNFLRPPEATTPLLSPKARAFVLGEMGYSFRAVGRLEEALRTTQEALEAQLALANERHASWQSANLAALLEVLGDLGRAQTIAEQSLHLVLDGPPEEQANARSALAIILHQCGDLDRAEKVFREAEQVNHARRSQEPFLYGFRGFGYCNLLLDLGRWREVRQRAEHTIQVALQKNWLRDIALDRISLGRAILLGTREVGHKDLDLAKGSIEQGLEGLRKSGRMDEIPRGLLARAELRLAMNDRFRSRADPEEVLRLCARCSMRLYATDAHLGFARLHLAAGEHGPARASLDRAKRLIEETGYHRRDREVAEIEAVLAGEATAPSFLAP